MALPMTSVIYWFAEALEFTAGHIRCRVLPEPNSGLLFEAHICNDRPQQAVIKVDAQPAFGERCLICLTGQFRHSQGQVLKPRLFAPICHHVNKEPVTKCRPGIFSCAGNRCCILTCDYVSYTMTGSSCETSIRRKVGGEGNGGVCMCVIVCVSV